MKYLTITLVLFSILLFSCKKKSTKKYLVVGRIVESCSGNIPVANKEFRFKSEGVKGSFGRDGIDVTVVTNNNGEFSFNYSSDNLSNNDIYLDKYFLEVGGFSSPIQAKQDANIGNFPLKNSFPIKVNLNVLNSYSASDSLFVISPYSDTLAVIPGPFVSGIYGPFLIDDYTGNFVMDGEDLKQRVSISFKSNIPYSTGNYKKVFYSDKKVKMCDQTEQMFEVEIE